MGLSHFVAVGVTRSFASEDEEGAVEAEEGGVEVVGVAWGWSDGMRFVSMM